LALTRAAGMRESERMKALLVLTALFAMAASAADIGGNWKGTAEGPNGAIERTFTFKVDGTKLTGETESQMMGKSTITDGKVEGNNISFTITGNLQGNEMKLNYKGTVTGDTIKLSVDFGGQAAEYTLKRVP
jgi:hypothetical protein